MYAIRSYYAFPAVDAEDQQLLVGDELAHQGAVPGPGKFDGLSLAGGDGGQERITFRVAQVEADVEGVVDRFEMVEAEGA